MSVPITYVPDCFVDTDTTLASKVLGTHSKVSVLVVEEPQVVALEADEQDTLADLFDANGLADERLAEADLFAIDAEPTEASDGDRLVAEGLVKLTDAGIVLRWESIEFARCCDAERLMRAYLIKLINERVEARLLLK